MQHILEESRIINVYAFWLKSLAYKYTCKYINVYMYKEYDSCHNKKLITT